MNDECYFAVADYVSVENCDVNIKVIHPVFRTSCEKNWWIPIHDIITKVDPPSSRSSCRFYCVDCDEMKCVQNLM